MKTPAMMKTTTDLAIITLCFVILCQASWNNGRRGRGGRGTNGHRGSDKGRVRASTDAAVRVHGRQHRGGQHFQRGSERRRSDDLSWRTGGQTRSVSESDASHRAGEEFSWRRSGQSASKKSSEDGKTSASGMSFLLREFRKISVNATINDDDFAILVLTWAPSKAEVNLLNGRIKDDVEPKWLVHGLWYPDHLKTNTTTPFITLPINMSHPLTHKMEEDWPSVNVRDNAAILWSHEWYKHGVYLQRSFPGIQGPQDYFQKTVDLFNSKQVQDWLAEITKQLPPGDDIRNANEVYERIRAIVGRRLGIRCLLGNLQSSSLLVEIRFCLDKGLNFIDCPGVIKGKEECLDNIRFPVKYLMFNSWMLVVHWMPTRVSELRFYKRPDVRESYPQWKLKDLSVNLENMYSIDKFCAENSRRYYKDERFLNPRSLDDFKDELKKISDYGTEETIIKTAISMWTYCGMATVLRDIPNLGEGEQRQKRYIQLAINFYNRLAPNEAFNQITTNRIVNLSEFRAAVSLRLGKNVNVSFTCFQPVKGGDHYIMDVRVCFNFDETPTDCFFKNSGDDQVRVCEEKVWYVTQPFI